MAEKIYSKSFGTICAPPTTWFHFELDTLYLNLGVYDEDEETRGVAFNFVPADLSDDIKRVKNLVMYSEKHPDIPTEETILEDLSRFGGVRQLTIVGPRYSEDDCSNLVFLDHSEVNEYSEYSMPFDGPGHYPIL